MIQLAKHTPGKPLSLAERIQRQRAARARWGAAAIAGAAGGYVAHRVVNRHDQALRDQLLSVLEAKVKPVLRANVAREARIRDRAARVRGQVKGAKLVPRALRTLISEFRAEYASGLRHAESIAAAGSPLAADHAIHDLTDELAPLSERIHDLRTNSRPARRVAVAGSVSTPRVAQFVRRGKQRTIEVFPDDPRYPEGKSNHLTLSREDRRALLAEARTRLDEIGPHPTGHEIEEAENLRNTIEMFGRPRRIKVRGEPETVTNVPRDVPARVRRIDPYPNTRERAQLRDHVIGLLDAKEQRILQAEAHRRIARIGNAKAEVREQVGNLLARRWLIRRGKGAVIGAALGLSAAGAHLLAGHVLAAAERRRPAEKMEPALNKAASDDSPERSIGKGIAETYREWIDRLLGVSNRPMRIGDDLIAGIGRGLTQAFADGARNPPIDQEKSDPRAWLEVDFDQLNPSTRRHMAEYSLDRIVQISEATREAIRTVLLNQGVLRGVGPPDVARQIRESIGLTSYQQSTVQSFRVALETLDPSVLDRKLRDKRYDRTVSYAIANQEPLSDAQVNEMVDAYHRRMLALRALTIARTEGLRATSFGGIARAQEILDEHPELDVTKKWLATDDERTRDTHRDLDGKEVDGMETNFVTSKGNTIRWPLDELAAADEVINCRCTLQFIYKPKRGQLVAVGVPA